MVVQAQLVHTLPLTQGIPISHSSVPSMRLLPQAIGAELDDAEEAIWILEDEEEEEPPSAHRPHWPLQSVFPQMPEYSGCWLTVQFNGLTC